MADSLFRNEADAERAWAQREAIQRSLAGKGTYWSRGGTQSLIDHRAGLHAFHITAACPQCVKDNQLVRGDL